MNTFLYHRLLRKVRRGWKPLLQKKLNFSWFPGVLEGREQPPRKVAAGCSSYGTPTFSWFPGVPRGRVKLSRGRSKVLYLAALLVFLPAFGTAWAAGACLHDLKIELHPDTHRLTGRDDILVEDWKEGDINIVLSEKTGIQSVKVNGESSGYSFKSGKLAISGTHGAHAPLSISIAYDAVFDDQIASEPSGFDNPGFGVMGSISVAGTFLLGDSGWYPSLAGFSEGFTVRVITPRGIYAVTAGESVGHEDRDTVSISTWKTGPIGQALSLSAGRYIIRSGKAGRIPVYTYFTEENDPLSKTYLDAAIKYIKFYESLHGAYPFPKFAIVENFFPTGYGFPSYTLLGATVLRLPFIPETSLRHEIAHSWWGNGVLVDYSSGNWCEGLTTYVADYLSQEISSASDGGLYRKQILRDYATLVASGADFPLRRFESRSSPASMAVGYGKAAFVFHMIRQKLGDHAFWRCLQEIFRERLFRKTSWEDFRDVFVRTGGWEPKEAKLFFDQWIERSGAPVLKLQGVKSQKTDDSSWLVTGSVFQEPPFYDLDITAVLKTSPGGFHPGTNFCRVETSLRSRISAFSIPSSEAPRKLIVDPDVNTFRLLDPTEIPATVNSVKGSQNLVAVLAEGTPSENVMAYEALLAGLNKADRPMMNEKEAATRIGRKVDLLFLGFPRSKKLRDLLSSVPKEVRLSSGGFSIKNSASGDCLFLVFKDPNRGGAITALFVTVPKATSGSSAVTAARKVTHYGKYSYVAFSQGIIEEKGIWETSGSLLEFDFIN